MKLRLNFIIGMGFLSLILAFMQTLWLAYLIKNNRKN